MCINIHLFRIFAEMEVRARYCSILDYLKDKHRIIHDVVKYLCLERSLWGVGKGTTFLIPSDKEQIKKLVDLTNNDDTLEEAEKMVKSLIITDSLPTLMDFDRKRDDLPNKNNQSLEFQSYSASGVSLSNGAKITPVKDFKTNDNRIQVYLLSGGSLPLTGPASKHKYTKDTKGKKTKKSGGGLFTTNEQEIQKMTRYLEEMHYSGGSDKFAEKVVAIYNSLDEKTGGALLPLMDEVPAVTYYLLVKPYSGGKSLVDVDAGTLSVPADGNQYGGLLKKAEEMCASYSANRDTLKSELVSGGGVSIGKELISLYNELGNDGTVGGKQVVPSETVNYLKSRGINHVGGYLLWQDEFRHTYHTYLKDVRGGSSSYEVEQLKLAPMYYAGNAITTESQFLGNVLKKGGLSRDEIYQGLYQSFIHGGDVLHLPSTNSGFATKYNKISGGGYMISGGAIKSMLRSYVGGDKAEQMIQLMDQ